MNCYEASKKRMEFIFNEFEHIYFSFSGGKDSSVMIQLANEVALKLNKKFDVLYIDLEGNYKSTRNHVKELKENLTQINEFYWVCLPLKLRNGVSQNQTHWACWDKEQKQNWIRPRPSNSINEQNYLKFGWEKTLLLKLLISQKFSRSVRKSAPSMNVMSALNKFPRKKESLRQPCCRPKLSARIILTLRTSELTTGSEFSSC
jgi:predicted phosphoadenosine phosphosulfate sulfurtransferase